MIEDIIDLPSKLNLAFLTQAYVLKECQIRIEDRGQPKLIALQAADTPRNTRFGEASGIDRIGQSGIVRGADPCIRVAQQNRSRVDIAARKVCDARPGTGSRGTRLQNVARRARLTGCQVSLSGTNRVGTTTVGEVQAIVVAKRLWLAGAYDVVPEI